jgi:hypothetical protein
MEAEKQAVMGVIEHLEQDIKEAELGIERDKKSIDLLKNVFMI